MTNSATFDYRGAQVLVTGGTSGIGHAIASAFADAGASVTVTGRQPTADGYETDLGRFAYHRCEMTDPDTIDALASSLDTLDILVNNAGANFPGGRDEWEPDVFAASLTLNLAGPMRLTVGCRRLLAASGFEGGASVINVVSLAAFRSIPIVPGYGSAKAGLVTLTGNLARQWVGDGIRVNAVAPGVIDTPMTAPMAHFPELLEAEVAHTPMGRLGSPADIVGAVLFLTSSSAAFVTGHTLVIDGGYLLPVTAPALVPHYHVGIVVPDLAAAQDALTTQLGVTWGPVLHLDATEVRDGTGADLVVPTTICYSVEGPHLELIEEVPGSVWVCNDHSNLHHVGFWSDDLPGTATRLADSGCPLQLCGRAGSVAPSAWAYHRNDLGVRIEIVDAGMRDAMAFLFEPPA